MEYKFTSMDEFDWSVLKQTRSGKWADVVRAFLESGEELCIISCKDKNERNNGLSNIRAFFKRNNVTDYVCGSYGPFRFYITNGKKK